MSDAALAQVNRIVSLVAELTRRDAAGGSGARLDELARRHGTTPEQIRRDVIVLTAASDEAETEWLSSICIEQEGDRLSVASRGPFRRPVRLTAPEVMAIQVGLAAESDPPPRLARDFALLLGRESAAAGPPLEVRPVPLAPPGQERVLALTRQAMDERRTLHIKYAGAGDRVGVERTVEPHDVVYDQGRYYIVAWCRRASDWRNFRADRVLDAALTDSSFTPRDDVPPVAASGGVFRSEEQLDDVDVRFSPAIARWIVERYPDAKPAADGSVVVTYHVADRQWLVRTVLQYGADAEVLGPPEYRSRMIGAFR